MKNPRLKLLFVEDDKVDYMAFSRAVRDENLRYDHTRAQSVSEARKLLGTEDFDVVLIDYRLQDGTAFDVLGAVPGSVPVVIVTGSGDEEVAVQAMKAGASDYLIKDPFNRWLKTLSVTVEHAIKARKAEEELNKFHAELERRVDERTEQLLRANQQLRQEIEQREKAEEALRQSEERFRTLTETTSEWIWEVDVNGVFTYASPRVRELLGYEPDEILGRPLFTLMPADEAGRVERKFMAIVKSRKPFRDLENFNVHKNGNTVALDASGLPYFDTDGQLRGYRGVGRDVTERKKAEELLIRSERLKAVAELSMGVAHNFNNMLQIVLSSAEVALGAIEKGSLESAKSNLEQIREGCRLGAETVRSLQEFARSRLDSATQQGRTFFLSRTVEKAVEMSASWWKSGPERDGITIGLKKDLDPACVVRGDENEIFEVAVNLIKNASEALPRGGTIAVKTYQDGHRAVLEVQDDGVGIKESDIGRIFEPFFTTKGFKGTGMGLASAYGIAVKHGGAISVRSREGQGATFVMTLPAVHEAKEDVTHEVMTATGPLRILVIDDQALIVRMLEQLLGRQGHTVFTALSGAEGLALFEQESPDLVICDLSMPVVTGRQVAQTVKELCAAKGVRKPPFLILTGWGKEFLQEESLAELGVDAVVEKPVNYRSLTITINELMARAGPEEPSPPIRTSRE